MTIPYTMSEPFKVLLELCKVKRPEGLDSVAFNAGLHIGMRAVCYAAANSLVNHMSPAVTSSELRALEASLVRGPHTQGPIKAASYITEVASMIGDGVPVVVQVFYDPLLPTRTTGPIELQYPAEGGEHELRDVLVNGHSILSALDEKYGDMLLEECLLVIERRNRGN